MHVNELMEDDLTGRLSAFGSSVEGTSLYLLRVIEATVDSLEAVERLANAFVAHASLLTRLIGERKAVVGRLLDPDDKAINDIESGYSALENALPGMLLKKAAIDNDNDLNDGHCELLHTAYDRCIAALADLIESSKNLRAAIITHDLAAEGGAQQSFENLGDLISDLRTSSAN